MDAALLWLLIAAWSGDATRRRGAAARRADDRNRLPEQGCAAPLRRRAHARSAWLRALEEIALVDRRMKPSPIRKVW